MTSLNDIRIVLLIRNFSQYGGIEYSCFRFYQYLKTENIRVRVLCAENRTSIKSKEIVELGLIRLGRFLKTFSFYLRAKNYLRLQHNDSIAFSYGRFANCHIYRIGDIPHLDYLKISLNAYSNIYQKLLKSISRFVRPINWLYPILESHIYCNDKVSRYISISSLVRKALKHRYQISSSKIKVINNGVNIDRFNLIKRQSKRNQLREKFNFSAHETIIGFCATNFERKGLRILIESLCFLPNEFRLLIAGGRNPRKFLRLANKRHVADRIHFLGKVDDMPQFYAAADLLCHPAPYEAFGNIISEAMAMGLPVVVSDAVGACDVIDHGINGYILNDLSERTLANAIQEAGKLNIATISAKVKSDEEVFKEYLTIIKEVI